MSSPNYVALLRGINVGGSRRVPMATLRELFSDMGFSDIVTYINSGNIIFSSPKKPDAASIQMALEKHFGFDLDVLVLSAEQVTAIAEAIPAQWQNNKEQKSDVIYLFSDVDSPDIIENIRYRPEFETIHYVPGALITNVTRENQPKSSLVKLIGTPLYRRMTIRNVITARKLAELASR